MNRHIKYYCQNSGAPGKHHLRALPQVILTIEEDEDSTNKEDGKSQDNEDNKEVKS